MSARFTVLHLECASTYGGSIRCLENFLRFRRDGARRDLVVLSHPLPEAERLAKLCDQQWAAPPAPERRRRAAVRAARALGHIAGTAVWLRRLVIREGVDVIRLNNGPAAHAPALLAARAAGVPCVAWLRSFPHAGERRWRWLTGGTTRLVAVSEAVRRAYVAEGVPGDRVVTIYDGTEIPLLAEDPARPRGRGFRVGTLGRLVAWKGLIDVVRAAALVLRHHPDTRFLLTGNEDPAEPGFRATLVEEMERLGIRSDVALGQFHPEPTEFVRSLDCLLNPSFPAEPFGMSIVEAMALERPVIATAAGGPAEIIEHGRSGLLVPPRDPEALAAAIRRLIEDRELRASIGREARRRVAERFEVGRQVAAQEAFLAGVAAEARRGARA